MATTTAYRYGITVRAGATTLPNPSAINITLKENEPIDWSVTFSPDPDRDFDPGNSSSSYYAVLQPDVFSDEYTIDRPWIITAKIGGTTFQFPHLVHIDTDRNENEQGFSSTFSGVDYSRNLLIENQSQNSYTSTSAHIYTAKEIIGEILTTYKIAYKLSFTDYNIREFHLQGETPIDAINSLLDVAGASWRFDGKTFVAYDPEGRGYAKNWTLSQVFSRSRKISTAGLKNQVTVCRTESQARAEEFEASGDSACGLQTISLATPKMNPQLRTISSTYGRVTEIDWIDEGGNFFTGTGKPAHGCQFIFKQDLVLNPPPNLTAVASYKVKVTGIPASMAGMLNKFDDAYSVDVTDETSQSKYGKLPAGQNIDNTLIPDAETAQEYGERWLRKQARLLDTCVITIPFNPMILPGHTVNDSNGGGQYYVEQIAHSIAGEKPTSQITGSKYQG